MSTGVRNRTPSCLANETSMTPVTLMHNHNSTSSEPSVTTPGRRTSTNSQVSLSTPDHHSSASSEPSVTTPGRHTSSSQTSVATED